MQIPNPVQESVWLDLSLMDFRPDARPHSEEELAKLAKSMSIRQFQNIIVCRKGERYEVIAGVGRILAARMLKWEKIRADVYEGLNEAQKLSMMFDENEDRENPPVLYQAKVLQTILQEEGLTDLTQQDLADKIGKDRTTVTKYIALFELSPKIWENVNAFTKLGMRHFAQFLRIENKDDQWKLAEITLQKGLSSTELRALVDKQLGKKQGAGKVGRPKGAKKVGVEGFAIIQRGSTIHIQGLYDPNTDLEEFITRLKAAILTWRTTHPIRATPPGSQ
jgi:ParB family chromosome partitioning protein